MLVVYHHDLYIINERIKTLRRQHRECDNKAYAYQALRVYLGMRDDLVFAIHRIESIINDYKEKSNGKEN